MMSDIENNPQSPGVWSNQMSIPEAGPMLTVVKATVDPESVNAQVHEDPDGDASTKRASVSQDLTNATNGAASMVPRTSGDDNLASLPGVRNPMFRIAEATPMLTVDVEASPMLTAEARDEASNALDPVSVNAQVHEGSDYDANTGRAIIKQDSASATNGAPYADENKSILNLGSEHDVKREAGQGAAVHHVQAVLQVEEHVKEQVSIEENTGGELKTRRPRETASKVSLNYIERLYEELNDPRLLAAQEVPPDSEGPTHSDKCCGKCIDCCCQAVVCDLNNIVCFAQSRRSQDPDKASKTRKNEIMTPNLQRGRGRGWSLITRIVLPICREGFRDAWVISELIIALIAFFLSVATISLGKNEGFHILHLVLSIIATILATADGIFDLRRCRSCKACRDAWQGSNNTTPEDSTKAEAAATQDSGETLSNISDDAKQKCCGKCMEKTKNVSDFIRMIAAELILYPLLVCDLFEFITGQVYNGGLAADIIGFILFLISLLALIFYTYFIRLLVLGSTIYHIQKERKKGEDEVPNEDPAVAKTALVFQVYFFIHVFGQMLAQILMLIAIGAKIQYDNRHLLDPTNTDETIRVSSYLWYMLVAGYIMPVCGMLTFFLVTYYWTQEFPIGVLIDMLRILEAPDKFDLNESINTCKEKFGKVKEHIHLAEIDTDFKKMRKKHFSDKFFYPFQSPMIIVLCLIYSGCQLGFVICAAVTVDENGQLVGVYLNGGGWAIFYYLAIIFAGIANAYVFLVAGVWLTIIIGVLILIAVIIGCVILCLLLGAGGRSNAQRH